VCNPETPDIFDRKELRQSDIGLGKSFFRHRRARQAVDNDRRPPSVTIANGEHSKGAKGVASRKL
jgi:hypothetical protein